MHVPPQRVRVGFNVNAEITVMFRIGDSVMFLQALDLRFAYRRNLNSYA